MFYGQCNACGERWGLGTVPTCRCEARLAQPEPEPVAWIHECEGATQLNKIDPEFYGVYWKHTPLYTAPPQREWQGLTDEDIGLVSDEFLEGAIWADAKLKEKNG